MATILAKIQEIEAEVRVHFILIFAVLINTILRWPEPNETRLQRFTWVY
jgi:hypothetical protein